MNVSYITTLVRRLLPAVLILAMAGTGVADAAIFTVEPGGLTIQQAIDAASDGDVIEVAPGTYTGPGNWDIDFRGKAITLRSIEGPEDTIIECGQPAFGTGRRGFYFHQGEDADSVLSGFTIRGGRMRDTEVPSDPQSWNAGRSHPIGGGIYCEFSSPTIVNCVIEDCGAGLGGGIGIVGGAPTITDCVVRECFAGGLGLAESGGRGGGIAVVAEAEATIGNCLIEGNSGHHNSFGAGLYVQSSTVVVEGSTIIGNTAPGRLQGGGAYCAGDATDVIFRHCLIAQNQADRGAGVFTVQTTSLPPSVSSPFRLCRVEIVNCTIADNTVANPSAPNEAGGVYSDDTDLRIVSSIIWHNDGKPLDIGGAFSPVSYSNVEGGYGGIGNLDADPLFASRFPADYHLLSSKGRWDPEQEAWIRDNVSSPCIDAGDPTGSFVAEPLPNGGRVNMGVYGGTPEASKGFGTVWHVDGSTGRDWNTGETHSRALRTLAEAFSMAENGDTVLVWPGVYSEELSFNGKGITVQSATDAAVITAPRAYAFSFYGAESTQSVLRNLIIMGCPEGAIYCNGASPTLQNLTIVGNAFGIYAESGARPTITNCIFSSNTYGDVYGAEASYSCFAGAMPDGGIGNISQDPRFVDPQMGDYHLKSRYGRYDPQTDTWITDTQTSPCIDRGDPDDDPLAEPAPNGGRVNMGAYGGTPYASMSSHN